MADETKTLTIVNDIAANTHNTYQFNNSTVFYSLVNSAFLPYYQQVVRKAQEWLDGFDPTFHKGDMVSSRIASKLMNGLKTSLFGAGLIFIEGKGTTDKEHKALNYISHTWADESDIQRATKNLIGYCLPIGTAAMKLNRAGNGKLWVESLRQDYFYYSVSARHIVNEFISFVRLFQTTDNQKDNYFLVEKRYFDNVKEAFVDVINNKKIKFEKLVRKPLVVYQVFHYEGLVTNNTMPTELRSIDNKKPSDFKTLPSEIKNLIKNDYGSIKIGDPELLPFGDDYLGVELFFNEGGDITNPSLPVGRSLVFDCVADFMEYDMERSFGMIDLYNSRGKVGIPRTLSQSQVAVPGTGGNMTQNSSYGQLNIAGYEFVPGLDPNTQKPIITQFEIRAQEHEAKQNAILKSVAMTVGVSARAIASFLVQNGEKTDDQIQSEDDSITQWVKSHRQDYIHGLNNIIEHVLNYNGYSDNIEVRFSTDGLVKGDKMLESIKTRLDLGMITLEDAIREYNPDLDEVQLQEKIQKALAEQERKQQESMNEFDEMYGENMVNNNGEENELNELNLSK